MQIVFCPRTGLDEHSATGMTSSLRMISGDDRRGHQYNRAAAEVTRTSGALPEIRDEKKSFEADAYHEAGGFVVEVEACRGVVNNQFLKDLFQACMMHDVTTLAIAVRNTYRKNNDFEYVVRFFNTLYASNRLKLPLEGLLIIGY